MSAHRRACSAVALDDGFLGRTGRRGLASAPTVARRRRRMDCSVMSRRPRLFAACAALALTAAAPPPDPEAQGRAWWAHIAYLASDAMHGRLTGTPDYDRA